MQGMKINVDYKSLKEAGTEADKLKNRLADLGSMDVPIHAHTGNLPYSGNPSAAAFNQYSKAISESITKLITPGKGWSTSANGAPVYTSPGGVQYAKASGGGGAGRFDGSPLMDAMGGGVGKLAKYAGLAMGIGGTAAALSWLNNSAEKNKIYEIVNGDLARRGGRFDNSWLKLGASYGFRPLEQQAIYDQLNTRMGLSGQHLKVGGVESMFWARKMGIPAEALAGYYAGTYHTGADIAAEKNPDDLSKKLQAPINLLYKAAVALGARGRMEEILQKNQAILTSIVANRSGNELTFAQREAMSILQMGMWSQPGQMGKGASGVQNFQDMDRSIRAGGTDPGAKIAMAKALGIDGVTSRAKYWEFLQRQEEGASPRNINAVLDQSESMAALQNLPPEEATAQAKLNLKGTLGLSPRQVDFWTRPGMRRMLKLLSTGNSKAALSSILDTQDGKARLKEAEISPEELMAQVGNSFRQSDAMTDLADVTAGAAGAKFRSEVKRTTVPLRHLGGALVETGVEMVMPGQADVKGATRIFREKGLYPAPSEENTGTWTEMILGRDPSGRHYQPPPASTPPATAPPASPVIELGQKSLDGIASSLERLLLHSPSPTQPTIIDMQRWK